MNRQEDRTFEVDFSAPDTIPPGDIVRKRINAIPDDEVYLVLQEYHREDEDQVLDNLREARQERPCVQIAFCRMEIPFLQFLLMHKNVDCSSEEALRDYVAETFGADMMDEAGLDSETLERTLEQISYDDVQRAVKKYAELYPSQREPDDAGIVRWSIADVIHELERISREGR